MFSLIAAIDKYNGIGLNGKIPWKCIEDTKFFKDTTLNHVVIMGRKTYESIGKHLHDRINIVVSSNIHIEKNTDTLYFNNLFDVVKYCSKTFPFKSGKKCFVIGGATIYNWFNSQGYIGEAFITKINSNYNCDTFFRFDYSEMINKTIKETPEFSIIKYSSVNKEELEILNIIRNVIQVGIDKYDRTGVGTISTFGNQLTFDLGNNNFPLMTTRPMFLRGIFEELMLYIRGQTDSKILESKGINVWQPNTTREFLDSRGLDNLPVGDMGPSYGFLFRYFGAEYKTCKDDYTGKGTDQLFNLINKLKTNPKDRRMIISLWDPSIVDKCPLPPCLYNYQFYVANNKLSCMMTQRSSDIAVAGGWNIATGSLLTIMLAAICNYEPAKLIWNIGDTHIYKNLIEQMKEQVNRIPYLFPKLYIKKRECITDYTFDDLTLIGYQTHPQIKLVMNA